MAARYIAPGGARGQISLTDMLDLIGGVVVAELKTQLVAQGVPDNTSSNIQQTIRYEITGPVEVQVFAPAYYVWIESGRSPGGKRPPLTAILDWMRRKGIAPGKGNTVAWAISSAIVKRGIRPRPFVQAAVDKAGAASIAPIFRFEIDKAFEAALRASLAAA